MAHPRDVRIAELKAQIESAKAEIAQLQAAEQTEKAEVETGKAMNFKAAASDDRGLTGNRDADGNFRITGRVDDVLIISGHNLGTAEIESAFVAHEKVAEAAVVGYPHDIKGNGLYCYVTLNVGEEPNGELERDLKLWVRKQIGPLATPDIIHFSPGLPKTRSGKIMRRILRKIAANEHNELGDTTTLADPSVVQSLVDNRKNI